uniref:Uncharacterized protein n=1 Tax=Bombyx mori TaxID=7091 RepID=A0A8R2R4L6_BOMMO|nr:peroxidase [Bombyx mori]
MKHFERLSVLLIPIVWSMGVQADDYYSSYYGGLLNSDDVAEYTSNGTLANCTNVVSPCDSTEGRRIDGTCNNLNYPSKGATRTPYLRILEAVYNHPSDTVFDPKLSEDGEELTGARIVRTRLVADGRVEDDMFTHCATHFAVFFATDITNTRDTTNYVSWRPFCCEEAGASDPMCAPNLVPADDYVHRYSGIRCLNMTRPLTFQTSGCLPMTTTPLRIVDATPLWDLSPVYGNTVEPGRRSNVNGTLAIETVNGVDFPPASGVNLLLGVNFFGIIFFWRFHNHIARKLLEVNQHWTDEQLFNTAREINIASGSQIFYYELMALLMGKLLMFDLMLRNQASLIGTKATKNNKIINLGLGGLQRSNDIMTNDLAKNRHSGFQSYIKYRAYCFGDNIASFDDLKGIIEKERIEALKDVYANVADIDLLAGVWVEIFKEGSHVPPTFYCIVKDQLLHNIKSDRHWYEREKRPNAFTEAQLAEIRKVTGARILCDIGDSVTAIQPSVFKLPGEGNKIVDCSEIPDIDYTAWSDN